MSSITIDLEEDLVALLHRSNQPLHSAVRELVVLELYRQGLVSSGKAAQRLNRGGWEFVQHAARLGIPYVDMTADEWTEEQARTATSAGRPGFFPPPSINLSRTRRLHRLVVP